MKSSIELIRLVAVVLIVFTHTRNNLESGIAYFVVEKIPAFGTAILSIVSGYLYFEVSRHKKNLFLNKIKSLLIPYLIANISVLLLVCFFKYVLHYDALNRLTFDASLIKEGLFSLNSPPINPPTYFVRDIFVIFAIIALFTQKEYKALLFIIPILLFGTLILRLDVAFLFLIGCLYSRFGKFIEKKPLIISLLIITIIIGAFFDQYLKFPISFFIFFLLIDIPFQLYKTGRYSYLLHLYHSPIIVISYPLLILLVENPLLLILAQILVVIAVVYVLFLITKKYKFLAIISGGR